MSYRTQRHTRRKKKRGNAFTPLFLAAVGVGGWLGYDEYRKGNGISHGDGVYEYTRDTAPSIPQGSIWSQIYEDAKNYKIQGHYNIIAAEARGSSEGMVITENEDRSITWFSKDSGHYETAKLVDEQFMVQRESHSILIKLHFYHAEGDIMIEWLYNPKEGKEYGHFLTSGGMMPWVGR